MDIDEYRKEQDRRMARQSAAPREPGILGRWVASLTRARRVRASLDPNNAVGDIETLLARVENPDVPAPERKAAIQLLLTARFLGPPFAPYEEAFRRAMRRVATDPELDIRREALAVLAADADPYALDLLVKSLRGPDETLISDVTAIQLLGYGNHGDYVPLIREVIARGPDEAVLKQAVRLLASDPGSENLLTELIRNRHLPSSVRRESAGALRIANPDAFALIAQEIIADDDEDDDLRATSLSALTHAGDYAAARLDPAFRARIREVESSTSSENLRAAACRFRGGADAPPPRPFPDTSD